MTTRTYISNAMVMMDAV